MGAWILLVVRLLGEEGSVLLEHRFVTTHSCSSIPPLLLMSCMMSAS